MWEEPPWLAPEIPPCWVPGTMGPGPRSQSSWVISNSDPAVKDWRASSIPENGQLYSKGTDITVGIMIFRKWRQAVRMSRYQPGLSLSAPLCHFSDYPKLGGRVLSPAQTSPSARLARQGPTADARQSYHMDACPLGKWRGKWCVILFRCESKKKHSKMYLSKAGLFTNNDTKHAHTTALETHQE